MKKYLPLTFLIIFCISACSYFKSTPELGMVFYEKYNNKLYKNFDTLAFANVFERKLDSVSKSITFPKTVTAFYQQNGYNPNLVINFLFNGSVDTLINYLNTSESHGFNKRQFDVEKIERLKAELDNNKFKKIDQIYPVIAELELAIANGYIKYTNFLNFGVVNPKTLFSRFYIDIKRPDSAFVTGLLNSSSLVDTIKAVQPKSTKYLDLQKALSTHKNEAEQRLILLNMERFRWNIPNTTSSFVEVNIPDYHLTWFNGADTVIRMKVCVGEKREANYDEKYSIYAKTKNLDDKPKNFETPLFHSELTSIQANPIWNIPVSIAQNEIYIQALRDPYYLSNNNINVYYKNKIVKDPDTINWAKYTRAKLPFMFKQASGEGNALGKFKFIFPNNSSIYLHDTPSKYAFNYKNRAVSHGCIRVEKPLEFAELLVNNPTAYDKLRAEVDLPPIDTLNMKWYQKRVEAKADTVKSFKLKPSWFGPKEPVKLLITYYTAWMHNDKLETRDDVYEMDEKLWLAVKKFR